MQDSYAGNQGIEDEFGRIKVVAAEPGLVPATIVSDGLQLCSCGPQSGAPAKSRRGDRLMAKVLGLPKPFRGHWRIVEMNACRTDFVDHVAESLSDIDRDQFGALESFPERG
ncbi:hypothetical protein NKJ84_28055 [Mesorhizobium sp. M0048]|uniref:hypothetical protein n=1 Tax=Mesorhizobium sp. M0048 TaxID=2956860 RepID=UPI003334B26E